jgi:hypothetical protein
MRNGSSRSGRRFGRVRPDPSSPLTNSGSPDAGAAPPPHRQESTSLGSADLRRGRDEAVDVESGSRGTRVEGEARTTAAEIQFALVGVLGVNHLAFRTVDPDRLHRFYVMLTGGDELDGEHAPIRVGQTLLVFFASEGQQVADDPDEIAFDVDAVGFDEVLHRARELGCEIRGPVEHTAFSKGFYLDDPDGRRLEFIHEDPGVYWRD